MSVDAVKRFFEEKAPDIRIIEHPQSTATVAQAAAALGVAEAQIAKTLALHLSDSVALFVIAGNIRMDNQKFKAAFGVKPRMLLAEQTLALTGHPVGGVCPFAVDGDMKIYCDVSLRAHAEIYPAAGSPNSAVRLSPDRLVQLVGAQWTDIGKA
ncbi:YbaK/EbsC family protein [Pseudomonas aeruginosa]|uniref:YbaK/EbsC family protein n=1 Tax=Pseudomonas aeruginosa TaxID=287 RepID=UPI0027389A95|nr:YbaK/EbsC family protein [Pseudomonas aeruginosa]